MKKKVFVMYGNTHREYTIDRHYKFPRKNNMGSKSFMCKLPLGYMLVIAWWQKYGQCYKSDLFMGHFCYDMYLT